MRGRIAVLIAAASLSLCAQAGERQLRVSPGEQRTITLIENPSTGYSWRIDAAASAGLRLLRIRDAGFAVDGGETSPPLAGAPGVHRWIVEALARGRARIAFVLARRWEKTPIERMSVIVEAR
jgi:inhibitor of cysteine peptidase